MPAHMIGRVVLESWHYSLYYVWYMGAQSPLITRCPCIQRAPDSYFFYVTLFLTFKMFLITGIMLLIMPHLTFDVFYREYSLCQKKPTTHSELGFRDCPGRGGLTVDTVDYLYGCFKETHCFGFWYLQPFGSYSRKGWGMLARIFLLLTIEQCNFHFQMCPHSFPSISKMVADIKTKLIQHVNNTDTNNWLGQFLALLVLGNPPKIMN